MVSQADIERFAQQVREKFHPQRIVLFGSHAHGLAAQDSDVDLLIVMPDDGDPLETAMRVREALDYSFPLDLVVRNSQDLAWRLENEDWFLREVMAKGRVLYEAPDP